MAVMIQFRSDVFNAGRPLAKFIKDRHRAIYTIEAESGRGTHIGINVWFQPAGNPQPPNSNVIVVKWGGPSWFETAQEFNLLPYNEVRSQIANAVERGFLEVISSPGGPAAAGTITCVAQKDIVDGEMVILTKPNGMTYRYHFDQTGTYVPGGGYGAFDLQVDISGDTTAGDVATTLTSVINGGPFFTALASDSVVVVSQVTVGASGNTSIQETVVDPDFKVSGFGGGGANIADDIRNGSVV